jgi:hypothetical protein
MALTRDFKALVQTRIARDPASGSALLREGIDTMLAGDVDTGKAILRDYIKATVGFEKLGEARGTPAKSLIRMLGPRGNPIHAMEEGSPRNSGAARRRGRGGVAKDPVRVRARLRLGNNRQRTLHARRISAQQRRTGSKFGFTRKSCIPVPNSSSVILIGPARDGWRSISASLMSRVPSFCLGRPSRHPFAPLRYKAVNRPL